MTNTATTITIAVLTLLALAAWILALVQQRRVMRSRQGPPAGADAAAAPGTPGAPSAPMILTAICAIGGLAIFLHRALTVHQRWQPLESHLDGLLLIGVLFATAVIYLQMRAGIRGLAVFALPFLVLVYAWSICASWWTLKEFSRNELHSVWMTVHLGSVYSGAMFIGIAAIAGGMYLYVQRSLRSKHDPTAARPFASLETIESLIVRTSALGFALISLGLVTGLIVVTGGPTKLGPGWWHSPKVMLAGGVWAIYAVVMNVKHTTNFRGARAAWLSIIGLVLLLATFSVATRLPEMPKEEPKEGSKDEPKKVGSARSGPLSRRERESEPEVTR